MLCRRPDPDETDAILEIAEYTSCDGEPPYFNARVPTCHRPQLALLERDARINAPRMDRDGGGNGMG